MMTMKVADADFKTNALRVAHRERLVPLLRELFRTQSVVYWIELLEKAGVPCGPILGVDGALNHPQTVARGMVAEMQHQAAGPVKVCGTPIRFSDTPGSNQNPASQTVISQKPSGLRRRLVTHPRAGMLKALGEIGRNCNGTRRRMFGVITR